ncbi:MAG: DUF1559 domain-containing protein, partial [Planctomycetaceae bacterium]|nr:DUF1559 domain-containing protein [Planctomycetaceae bacterium]
EAARRSECRNKLKQIGLALHNYHDTHGAFPPGGISHNTMTAANWCTGGGGSSAPGYSFATWTVMILPFLDQSPRYNQLNFGATFISIADRGQSGGNNDVEWARPFGSLQCPSDPNSGTEINNNNYYGSQGGGTSADAVCTNSAGNRYWMTNGVLYHNSSTRMRDITDGTSNVFLVGETKYQSLKAGNPSQYLGWASSDWPLATYGSPTQVAGAVLPINSVDINPGTAHTFDYLTRIFGSWHEGGCHFLLCDGSVQFVSENVNTTVYQQTGKRSDGLPIGSMFE